MGKNLNYEHFGEAYSFRHSSENSEAAAKDIITGSLLVSDTSNSSLKMDCSDLEEDNSEFSTTSMFKDLSAVKERSDIVVFMDKLTSMIGYRYFLIAPSRSQSRRSVISNWPSYLVEFFLSTQPAHGFIYDQPTENDTDTPYFEYDLLQSNSVTGTNNNLHSIIDGSGLRRGVGYVCEGCHQDSGELLVLFASPVSKDQLPKVDVDFSKICSVISGKINSSNAYQDEVKYKISKRELECIRWTAEGKTSYEISVILNLSENTVNNYIATAAKKVGAVNRSHMISIAARSGIIH